MNTLNRAGIMQKNDCWIVKLHILHTQFFLICRSQSCIFINSKMTLLKRFFFSY